MLVCLPKHLSEFTNCLLQAGIFFAKIEIVSCIPMTNRGQIATIKAVVNLYPESREVFVYEL